MMLGVDTEVVLAAITDALDTVSEPWAAWGVVVEHLDDEVKAVAMLRGEFVAMLRSAPSEGQVLARRFVAAVENHPVSIPVLLLPKETGTMALVFVKEASA